MEFKELTEIWKQSDMHQDEAVKINHQLIREIGLSKIKSNLKEIKWSSIFEIIVEILFNGFLVNFLINHQGQTLFVIPAYLILILNIFNMFFEIYRLSLYWSINADGPVLKAQKKLSRLKRLEIFDTYSLLVVIPIFALPLVIVIAKALLNLNLFQFGTGWMIQLSAGSIAVAVILVLILRRYPNRKLKDAMKFIDELGEE